MKDKELFQEDIEQQAKDINTFASPLVTKDTQNKIWVKILNREKENYEVKKRIWVKQQQIDQSHRLKARAQQDTYGSRLWLGVTFPFRKLWGASTYMMGRFN